MIRAMARRLRAILSSPRRRPRCRPALVQLESRDVPYVFGVTGQAIPGVLPHTGRFVPVHFSGEFLTTRGRLRGIPNFTVADDYRRVEPHGRLQVRRIDGNKFAYSGVVHLQATRADEDAGGRLYAIIVAARDLDGSNGKVLPVLVPRDPTDVLHRPFRGTGKGLPPIFSKRSLSSGKLF